MRDQDGVAIARIVLTNSRARGCHRGRSASCLPPDAAPYRVRDEDDYFSDIRSPRISRDMVELASHILKTKAAHFDPRYSRISMKRR